MMSHPDWSLTIGEIVAPFSRFGEVKVRLETDFPDRFARLAQVCVRWSSGAARLYAVESARLHKRQIVLKLQGVSSIEEAEALRNTWLQVRAEEAVRLPANEFYIHDLIGCAVLTSEGRLLGPVTSVLRGGANDVFVIGEGKEEILLPVVKEVVQSVNIGERRIVVTPTPGLLSENLTIK
jgi:16S rRNA processing protein RimM